MLTALEMIEPFMGSPIPNHELASYPGTNSPTVGKAGSASARVVVVTASARNLPASIYSIDAGSSPK
jgi:hypothetical protein